MGHNPRKNIVPASAEPWAHPALLSLGCAAEGYNLREVGTKPQGLVWLKLRAQLLITASALLLCERCQDLEKKLWKRRGRRSMKRPAEIGPEVCASRACPRAMSLSLTVVSPSTC